MRTVAALACMLILWVLQGVAELPEAKTRKTNASRDHRAEKPSSRSSWREQRAATLPGDRTKHGDTTQASEPFIRPIAPMQPLFANDDLLRIPWDRFGFRRSPVLFHSRPAIAVRRVPFTLRGDLRTDASSPNSFVHGLSPLTHPVSERARPALSRPTAAFLEPLSSDSTPSTGISSARATQIQTALMQYGYLHGAPTGSWDAPSVAAMRKLQSDHHWQTKFMPDARALIFLGLGPGSQTP